MISYDTNILIYAFGSNGAWSDKAIEVILKGERSGAVLSQLSRQEFLLGLLKYEKDKLSEAKNALESFVSTTFMDVTKEIVDKALEICVTTNFKVKNYDAVLLATAIVGKASEFWTNDKVLANITLPDIDICSL